MGYEIISNDYLHMKNFCNRNMLSMALPYVSKSNIVYTVKCTYGNSVYIMIIYCPPRL